MLYELIYVSLASWQMNADDLESIIDEANQKNVTREITGCLYYNDRTFIQVLEGEKNKVLDLFLKITKDARHLNVQKIWEGAIEERAFPNFSMGFFLDENQNYQKEISQILDEASSKSSVAKILFESLVKELS